MEEVISCIRDKIKYSFGWYNFCFLLFSTQVVRIGSERRWPSICTKNCGGVVGQGIGDIPTCLTYPAPGISIKYFNEIKRSKATTTLINLYLIIG